MDALGWLAVVGGVGLVLVAADRLVARLPPRERPVERPGRPTSGGGAPFGELVEIFEPSARHLHEEQERQRHDLVEVGDADPPWQVDLDAGTAVLPGAPGPAGAGPAGAGPAPAVPAASSTADPRVPAPRELVEVAPGVLVATAQPWSTTTTVVLGPGGRCLVVDPALTPADLEGLAVALLARGLTVEAGASTHPHWDHVLWSRSLGDVPRWASPDAVRHATATREALVRDAAATAPGHDETLLGDLTPLTTPDVPWSGPRTVVVPHAAHCPGSVALVVPDAHVMLAGDLLSDVEVPLLDLDHPDPVASYREALDALEDAARRWSVRVLVPGHGTPTDAAGLRARLSADRAYLAALDAADPHVTEVRLADPRLADPEQARQHHEQLAALAAR